MLIVSYLKIAVVMLMLLMHGINPFKSFLDILPAMKKRLNDREKKYIVDAFGSEEYKMLVNAMLFK